MIVPETNFPKNRTQLQKVKQNSLVSGQTADIDEGERSFSVLLSGREAARGSHCVKGTCKPKYLRYLNISNCERINM